MLAETALQAHGQFRDLEDWARQQPVEFRTWRASGNERLKVGGGEIRFRTARSARALEGLRPSVVYLSSYRGLSPREVDELLRQLAMFRRRGVEVVSD